MGRKANFEVKIKKGPGRKSKKQKPPIIPKDLIAADDSNRKTTRKRKNKSSAKPVTKTKVFKKSEDKDESLNSEIVDSEEEWENESSDEGDASNNIPAGFTDDNKLWLKPAPKDGGKSIKRKSLLSNDDEDQEGDSDDDDDLMKDDFGSDSAESDPDDDDLLPIEKKSKKLAKLQREDEKLAEEELMTNVTDSERYPLPTGEELQDPTVVTDLSTVQQRIKDVVQVLADFSNRHEVGRSRAEYIDVLKNDLCIYYSYNEFLIDKLMTIFSIPELVEFLEASEVQRPMTIRTNTLKTRRRDLAQALIGRGINLDPVGKWTKEGLVIYDAQVPIGATPEYLGGHYIIQGSVSMMPVLALEPQPNEKILDFCSAPGGKASHIASLMKNTGVLFANDSNSDRLKAVVGNFHRLGITNSVVCNYDGRNFPKIKKDFDRCLLDAPCSGTGVISKDPTVKTNKDEKDIKRCSHIQKELILRAIDCVDANSKTGAIIVYSTCSVLPEENESVIQYALNKRNVKLIPTGLEFGVEGMTKHQRDHFHPQMKLTRRYYPHTHNLDGFYVAKLKKFSNTIPNQVVNKSKDALTSENDGGTENASKAAATDGGDKKNEKPKKKAGNKRKNVQTKNLQKSKVKKRVLGKKKFSKKKMDNKKK